MPWFWGKKCLCAVTFCGIKWNFQEGLILIMLLSSSNSVIENISRVSTWMSLSPHITLIALTLHIFSKFRAAELLFYRNVLFPNLLQLLEIILQILKLPSSIYHIGKHNLGSPLCSSIRLMKESMIFIKPRLQHQACLNYLYGLKQYSFHKICVDSIQTGLHYTEGDGLMQCCCQIYSC